MKEETNIYTTCNIPDTLLSIFLAVAKAVGVEPDGVGW